MVVSNNPQFISHLFISVGCYNYSYYSNGELTFQTTPN